MLRKLSRKIQSRFFKRRSLDDRSILPEDNQRRTTTIADNLRWSAVRTSTITNPVRSSTLSPPPKRSSSLPMEATKLFPQVPKPAIVKEPSRTHSRSVSFSDQIEEVDNISVAGQPKTENRLSVFQSQLVSEFPWLVPNSIENQMLKIELPKNATLADSEALQRSCEWQRRVRRIMARNGRVTSSPNGKEFLIEGGTVRERKRLESVVHSWFKLSPIPDSDTSESDTSIDSFSKAVDKVGIKSVYNGEQIVYFTAKAM